MEITKCTITNQIQKHEELKQEEIHEDESEGERPEDESEGDRPEDESEEERPENESEGEESDRPEDESEEESDRPEEDYFEEKEEESDKAEEDELQELLPSQFILPADLYDEILSEDEEIVSEEIVSEGDKIDKISKRYKINKRDKQVIDEDIVEEIFEEPIDNYIDDVGGCIDMDEDIRLVDLGFDKLEIK
jgi:hypothetical protein